MNSNSIYEVTKFYHIRNHALTGLIILFCTLSGQFAAQAQTFTPLSQKYVACPNAPVTIGFQATSGITYYWYTVQSGGSPVGSGNTRTETKDATAMQTWWVEPSSSSATYPRIRVDIELGDCEVINPIGCATTGTILYKEDFGGNSPDDPTPKTSGIPQVIGYIHSPTLGGGTHGDQYTIAKSSATFWHSAWNKNIDDHTYPNDLTRGYLIGFDGSATAGQLYESQIDGLCSGSELYFSIWISNIILIQNIGTAVDVPQHIFILEDLAGNVLGQYYTFVPNNGDNAWKQYGFKFIVPDNVSSVKLKIINNSTGTYGNDFAFDDMEIRLCAPPVTLTQPTKLDTVVCIGNTFTFQGSYTDDETFGNSLVYRWEHNPTGDINSPAAWTPITSTRGTSVTGTVNSVYTVNSVSAADAGYYRLAVANAANIDNYNCRAMSDIIHLQVLTGVISGTATGDQTVCSNTVPATLTATESTGGSAPLTYQWQQSTDGGSTWPDVSAGTGGTTRNYTPPPLTQTTQYRLKTVGGTAPCETVYSNAVTLTVRPVPGYPDIRVRVCPDVGDISLAKYIDTVDNITDIQWAHQISGIPVSSPEGTVSTGNLSFSRVHTLTYTVSSNCVSEQKRKIYLEVLKDGRMRPLKDTVEICHLQAGAVQINQLFGIEAGGTWSPQQDPNVAKYITESTSPTYSGAVVMNGKGIYGDSSIPFITYHGVNKAKAVKFTYTADIDGCLKGTSYSIVVVLTED